MRRQQFRRVGGADQPLALERRELAAAVAEQVTVDRLVVLAQQGRRGAQLIWRALHLDCQPRIVVRAHARHRQLLEEADFAQVRVLERFERIEQRSGADAGGLQGVEQLVLVAVGGGRADQGVERVDVAQALLGRREAAVLRRVPDVRLVGAGVGGGEHIAERDELRVAADVDRDPLVVAGAGVDIVRRVPAVAVGLRGRVEAVHGVVEEVLGERGDEALVERHLDQLPLAGPLAMPQRHQHGDCALHAGESVAGERFADFVRAAVGVAAQVGVADHRFDVQPEGAVAAVGPFEAEGGHAQHDQARVDLAQLFPADAGSVDRLRHVVFDQHIALGDQFQEGLAALFGHDVAGHRALVAGVGVERGEAVPGVAAEFGVGILRLHAALGAA